MEFVGSKISRRCHGESKYRNSSSVLKDVRKCSTCARLSADCGSAVGLLNTGHGLCLWCSYWSGHKRVLTVFGDWTKAPPRYHLHKILSHSLTPIHTHTHTHINMRAHRAWMEFVHNCVSGLIHLQGDKNVFFGADQHANNRGKGKRRTLFCARQWLAYCGFVPLCIVSSDYNMANCSPEDLMTGEQRTIV